MRFLALLLIVSSSCWANTLQKITGEDYGSYSIVNIVSDSYSQMRYIQLAKPQRVVLDLNNLNSVNPKIAKSFRSKQVQDLKIGIHPNKVRVVIANPRQAKIKFRRVNKNHAQLLFYQGQQPKINSGSSFRSFNRQPEIEIVLDPGHGGHDPGTKSKRGALEKNISLSLARKIRDELNKRPYYHVTLTRDSDKFIPLRKRIEIARKHNASLFISIHENYYKDARIHGAVVYTLSQNGSDNEASRITASRENIGDVGIPGIKHQANDMQKIIIKLQQTNNNRMSDIFARILLNHLVKYTTVHKRKPGRAAFVVLKSAEIPSVLVETGYLSNPYEAKKLASPYYQKGFAFTMAKAVDQYFSNVSPKSTNRHNPRLITVRRGDSLSKIAYRYHIKVSDILAANSIKSVDKILIGQHLYIPT